MTTRKHTYITITWVLLNAGQSGLLWCESELADNVILHFSIPMSDFGNPVELKLFVAIGRSNHHLLHPITNLKQDLR